MSFRANIPIENATYAYLAGFVDELARSGVRDIVVCPGSRSTPLAYSFAAHPDLKIWMHYDERSAGFFALGLAKAAGRPAGLVCTSGTAAANFLPAVVEAYQSRAPLVVMTADRPAELRDNGAPQAINQLRLYGSYAKWFVEMALPEANDEMLRYARTVACRAAGTARMDPAGPVHLNMPFREPLTPAPIAGQPLPPPQQRDSLAWYGRPDGQPYVSLTAAPRRLEPADLNDLAAGLSKLRRGLLVCGPQDDPALAEPLVELARRLGYPVLADPLSQLRCGRHDRDLVLPNYDAFLRDSRFTGGRDFEPEVVLRFGAMPTSKPLLLFLKRFPGCQQIVVDGGDGWQEPTQLASRMVYAEPARLCQALIEVVDNREPEAAGWLADWQSVSRRALAAVNRRMESLTELFEGRALAALADLLPDTATLFVGNSMPVRDLDSFFAGTSKNIRLLGNRGANGIDGLISSALGAAAASDGPLALVLGDLSTYHDLNGLLAARLHRLEATIIVLNNDGGGIFSFLPQAAYPDNFEQLFGTPHGLDFEPAMRMYGADFRRVAGWPEYEQAVRESFGRPGLKVIEVPTDRARNVTLHRQMWAAIYDELAEPAGRPERV